MQIDLPPVELMTAVYNNLNKRFFETTRNDAKQLYVAISDGRGIPFMAIVVPEKGNINCSLALDQSQFVGKLNFSSFKKALASHLQRIAEKLGKQEDLNMYINEANGDKIFNLPGLVETGDTVNILVTGIEQRKAGSMTIRLMFLDPENLARSGEH